MGNTPSSQDQGQKCNELCPYPQKSLETSYIQQAAGRHYCYTLATIEKLEHQMDFPPLSQKNKKTP